MRKGILVFLRVTFFIIFLATCTLYGMKAFYQYQSRQAIDKALVITDAPMVGDKDLPFTIVEFFDYRCPDCYELNKILMEAIDDSKDTKILLRPSVVVDNQSYEIAAFVLALDMQHQGATALLHKKIMNLASIPTYETVKAMAVAERLNVEQAERDSVVTKPMVAHNTALVQKIGFYGTPALVIGDKGFIPQQRMPSINELKLMIIDAKIRLKIIPTAGD